MAKKKKLLTKCESKVAISMSDQYVKQNPVKASEGDTTGQASKKVKVEETSNISHDVATPNREKGNLDAILMSDVPESGRKLGLKDLKDAIDSTEYMDADIPTAGNETKVDVSVEKDLEKSDAQEDVGPDVGTSLGQPDNHVDVKATVSGEKDSSFETAPEKDLKI